MKPEEITTILTDIFGDNAVERKSFDCWQVSTDRLRLLVILSQDASWLRLLVPIVPAKDAQPFLQQILEANFESTQQLRYASNQGVLWAVYCHTIETLTDSDFKSAIASAVSLRDKGLSEFFNSIIEGRIREIIKAAKSQKQSLEVTLKSIERLYREGMLGGLEQVPEERDKFIAAWQYQLQRLWSEVEPD